MTKGKRVKAVAWVGAFGKDCDGCNGGHLSGFASKEEAEASATSSNEWSDGLQYAVLDYLQMIDYCGDYGITFTNHIYV